MTEQPRLKQTLLYSLIGSVLFGALLGIVIVLRNEWGWFEVRVILTTITVAVASLAGLACDLSRTPRGYNLLPRTGLALTFLSAALILLGIWPEIDSEVYWKTTTIVTVFAVATVHVSLLSIAWLAKRFRWVYWLTKQVVFGLAALIATVIVFEIDEEVMFRFIATVAIVDAALTLVIPLLHRISKTDRRGEKIENAFEARNLVAIDEEIEQLKKRIAKLEQLKAEIQA